MFEHAVSQVPLTLPSHASLFTGLYPPHHAVRDNGGFVLGTDATTLAERFQAPATGPRVRLVLRAPFPLGHWPGARDLRRLLRLRRTREPRSDRRRTTRGTSRGRGARLAAAATARRAPVLPLGPPLRSARPVRADRRVPPPRADRLRRRGHVRRRPGRAAAGGARHARTASQHRGRVRSPITASRSASTASRPTASSCTAPRSTCR